TMQLMVELTDAKWATHLVGTRAIVLRDAPLPTALAAPPEPEKPSLPSTSPPDQRGVLARDDRVWIGERRGATWTSWTGKRATDVRPTKQKDAGSAERARAAHGDRGLRPARMSCSTAAPRVLPHADVDHVGRNSNVEHQHRRCSASCYSRH
ncbi:MAG TPA: hypothetical protein VK427_20855, partial [Kofleriaceae bacterium]|nr:hypothetical protein [Kofleriaceae bacterium]